MFKRNLPLLITIAVFVAGYLFCMTSFPAFLSTRILCNILTDNAFLGIVAALLIKSKVGWSLPHPPGGLS